MGAFVRADIASHKRKSRPACLYLYVYLCEGDRVVANLTYVCAMRRGMYAMFTGIEGVAVLLVG